MQGTETNPGSYWALLGTHGGGLWRPLDCSDDSDGADGESPGGGRVKKSPVYRRIFTDCTD